MGDRLPDHVLENARALRRNQTDAENLLWLLLRSRGIGGYKFRRQHPVGNFILDFYCKEAGLAVELDGGEHNDAEAAKKDGLRSQLLNEQGINVVRFWNHEVLRDTEAVLERIYLELTKGRRDNCLPHPCPSPRGRGDK